MINRGRLELATSPIRSDLGRLLSWRCTLDAHFKCDCHRELSQIQASSLNSLKFSILQIRPGPFLNVTYKHKELRAFPAIFAPLWNLAHIIAGSAEWRHLAQTFPCIQSGPVDVRPSLWRSSLGASLKSGRLVQHWVNDRPESATTRSD